MRVDLHIHTTASDGCWYPSEVVAHVLQAGIGLFAIADHDTVAHVQETARLAHEAGLAFLTGVEISTRMDRRLLHVVGYGIEPSDAPLRRLIQTTKALMEKLSERNLYRLAQGGYPIDLAAYETYEYDPARGGWKVLNYLLDLGLCEDVWDYMARLNVDPFRPSLPDLPSCREVTAVIRAAGGVPVLAHPGASLRDVDDLPAALERLVERGIEGVECHSPYHDPQTTATCLALCERFDLLVTGGSDCHGGFAKRAIGVPPVEWDDLRLGVLEEKIG